MKATGSPAVRPCLAPALLLALCACTPKPPVAPPPAAPKPLDGAARAQWYQQCWGYFNGRQWDAFTGCYAADAVSTEAGYGQPEVRGAQAIVASAQGTAAMAPDVRGEQQLILINGNHLASLNVLHGTNTGPTKDASGREGRPTGKSFGLWFAHSIEVNDSQKVTREFGASDGGTMAAQLGLSKAPARPLAAAPTAPPTVVVAAADATEEQNVAADKAGMEAWNRHDAAATEAAQADDYVFHDASYARDLNRTENSADTKGFWAGFSDARLTADSVWAAGPYVVVQGRFDGTNDGSLPMMKLKKTGRKVTLPFLAIDRFANGKVAETWLIYDSAALGAQLMGPAPKK